VPIWTPGPQYTRELEKGKVFFGELVRVTGMKAE
jgi:hypothetical protein